MVLVLAGCVPSLTGFISSVEGFLSVEEMEKEGRRVLACSWSLFLEPEDKPGSRCSAARTLSCGMRNFW
jgi:hypothetical protein